MSPVLELGYMICLKHATQCLVLYMATGTWQAFKYKSLLYLCPCCSLENYLELFFPVSSVSAYPFFKLEYHFLCECSPDFLRQC